MVKGSLYTVGALILLLLLSFCTGSGDTGTTSGAVPRRYAYPRLQLPDSIYKSVEGLPIDIEVNAESDVEVTKEDNAGLWLTVSYPVPEAEIYYTFTPVSEQSVPEVIDNRLERISLNLGGNEAEMLEFQTPAGLAVRIFKGGSVTTPVQFIATDYSTVVVSGSAFMEGLSALSRDSLSPAVEVLTRDIIHSLTTLGND